MTFPTRKPYSTELCKRVPEFLRRQLKICKKPLVYGKWCQKTMFAANQEFLAKKRTPGVFLLRYLHFLENLFADITRE